MTRVAAILPCRGRAEQTARNVRRLLDAAGDVPGGWQLHLVGGADEGGLITDIARETAQATGHSVIIATGAAPRLSYWQALQLVTERADAPLLCGLANDLLPGARWLQRAVEAYDATFGAAGDGLMGFNGDSHLAGHSCHVLISRGLLARYGGWPVWYDHAFGDTELCLRAQADRLYAKAPWALLYHDHPYVGAGNDDAVYAEGRAQLGRDEALFQQRRAAGWPTTSR